MRPGHAQADGTCISLAVSPQRSGLIGGQWPRPRVSSRKLGARLNHWKPLCPTGPCHGRVEPVSPSTLQSGATRPFNRVPDKFEGDCEKGFNEVTISFPNVTQDAMRLSTEE